jgi:thiamine pyrophosphokinase
MESDIDRVILFANGDFPEPERLLAELTDQDYLVAVDGGLQYITKFNLVPNLIIGDMDSANPDDMQKYQSQGVEIRQYPQEKDETDLELALQIAQGLQPKTVWVLAALGNRLDQTLANIFLLTSPKLIECDIRLVDGHQEVFMITKAKTLMGKIGDRVSLLPLNGPVIGVQTENLYYPLKGETLYPDQSRGISNLMTSPQAKVSLRQGLLLCIHEFSQPQERSGKND